jgi:hypothetical protein
MSKGRPFPPEATTRPDFERSKSLAPRRSNTVPKRPRDNTTASTVPPSSDPGAETGEAKHSNSAERPASRRLAAAKVDEVTADLSHDWRSERDD